MKININKLLEIAKEYYILKQNSTSQDEEYIYKGEDLGVFISHMSDDGTIAHFAYADFTESYVELYYFKIPVAYMEDDTWRTDLENKRVASIAEYKAICEAKKANLEEQVATEEKAELTRLQDKYT